MSMPKLPCTLECPRCTCSIGCSAEDPDAGMSEMYRHLLIMHCEGTIGSSARAAANALLAQVTVAPDA
jgi:hypothetical protein